nr:SDR family oxidoreductase [Sphingobium nicotianae]
MLLGAGGFIGRQIMAELLAHGHDLVAVVRRVAGLDAMFPAARFVTLDLARATGPADWAPHLPGIDLVINCAGILRGRDMVPVHVDMPRALYAAAREAGVKRVVLISAISARPDVATDYAQAKLAGEAALRDSGLGWTILRPSLVYGDGSYGGTSLVRGLAGLPLVLPVPGDGHFPFTPIHVRDLARAIRVVCETTRFDGQTLDPTGPETLNLRALLLRYRGWLGFAHPVVLPVPMPVMHGLARLGDLLGSGPISSNSLEQMVAGNAGDGEAFARAIGFAPRSLGDALRDHPAQVQDRWHARLYFLAPLLRVMLLMMWLASVWLGLCYGHDPAAQVVRGLGLGAAWADPLRWSGSLLDLALAIWLLLDRTGRSVTLAQCVVILGYTLVIGVAVPALWLDPYGALLKNLPVLGAVLVYGAIADRR